MKPRHFRPAAPQKLFPGQTTTPSSDPGFDSEMGRRGRQYDRKTPPMNRGYPVPHPAGKSPFPKIPWKRGLPFASPFFGWPNLGIAPFPWIWAEPNDDPLVSAPVGYHTLCYVNYSCAVLLDCGLRYWTSNSLIADACTRTACSNLGTPWNTTSGSPLTYIYYGHGRGIGCVNAELDVIWEKNTGATPPIPMQWPKIGRIVLPAPWDDPWAEPWADPLPQVEYGPSAKQRAAAAAGTAPALGPATSPTPQPGPGPSGPPGPPWKPPMVEYGPGFPAKGRPGRHEPSPPRGGDREKKAPAWKYGAAGKFYGTATEFKDALDCVNAGMAGGDGKGPCRGPGPSTTLQDYAACIWSNMNKPDAPWDPAKVGMCLAGQQAGDAAVGALSGGAAKARNKSPYSPKRPGGYQGGDWGTRMH